MKEFAKNGFKNASTDMIVKEADISKGALFHYFKNKKCLFLFLYNYAMDVLKNEIFMKFNYEEKDIFIRLRQIILLKLEIHKRYPEMYDFVLSAYMEDSSDVKNDLKSTNNELNANYQRKMFEGIDSSKFKDGVDVIRTINIIIWTVEGFANKEMEKIRLLSLHEVDFNEMIVEIDIYLEILKKSFYKSL